MKPRAASSVRENANPREILQNFSFESAAVYADKADYASRGLIFDILKLRHEPGGGYDGKDRWAITVKVADRDCEILTLGCNSKRDQELAAAQAHLARGGTITTKRLRCSGHAYYITDGDR